MGAESQWTAGSHPSPEELLLATENQLSEGKADAVLAHLHQCWQCRSRVELFSRGIDSYVKFRESELDPALAPPAGGWMRLSARIKAAGPKRLDKSVETAGRSACATSRSIRATSLSIWGAASLAAAGLIAAFVLTPRALTAQAVFDHAITAESVRAVPVSLQRVRVRRAGKLMAMDDLVLETARIRRSNPLSVAPFRAWHDSLRTRQDSIAATEHEIRVETKTEEGLISLASLTVARTDYQPHAKHVELRDGVTIDVDTVTEEVPAPRESAPTPESTTGVRAPATPDRDALELEVRWALRRIDADLGEALEIQPSGDGVVVSGTLDDAARRDQIAAALRGTWGVSTQLRVAVADTDLLADAQPIDGGASGASPLLTPQLAKDFPEAESRRTFASRALHLSHDILRHSWALRRLADRYPSSATRALRPAVRTSLAALVAAHQQAIDTSARDAAALWKPYAELDSRAGLAPTAWQPASLATLQGAQAFDHITVRLVAAGGDDGLAVNEALRQLQESYRRLP